MSWDDADSGFELHMLKQEREEQEATATLMRTILTKTANVLKGKPAELSIHSWHDLPEIAQRLIEGLKEINGHLHHAYVCAKEWETPVSDDPFVTTKDGRYKKCIKCRVNALLKGSNVEEEDSD